MVLSEKRIVNLENKQNGIINKLDHLLKEKSRMVCNETRIQSMDDSYLSYYTRMMRSLLSMTHSVQSQQNDWMLAIN